MLHNTTREAFLQEDRGQAALVIDALYHSGFKMFQQFNYDQAAANLAWLHVNSKLLRSALQDPIFAQKGRRNRVYTLPAPSTARKSVNARNSAISDILPDEAYQSVHHYRRALHFALIARRPGVYSRALLAQRLGVCKKTTRNYDRELGVYVSPTFLSFQLSWSTIGDLPSQRPAPGMTFLAIWDEKAQFISHFSPFQRQIAAHWLAKGRRVDLQEQQCNFYQPEHPGLKYITGKYADFIQH